MYKSIIDKHQKIKLESKTHTYTLSGSNTEFSSVTEFINTFFLPFNEKKIANKLTQLKKYQHMSVQDILNDWEKRRNRGTIVHKEIEEFLISKNNQIKTTNLDSKSIQGLKFLQEKCTSVSRNYS